MVCRKHAPVRSRVRSSSPVIPLVRLPNWHAHLDYFLVANRDRQFGYGQFDCCLFVCDAIQAITGTDPAAPFRDRYSSLKGARREMKEYCGSPSVANVVALVASRHGMPEIPPLCAGRGDIVLITRPPGFSLGLVALNGREIVVTAQSGLELISLSLAVRAWRV